jgi:dipeptidyl aminopeptidase/acylaminoacyl peptidase
MPLLVSAAVLGAQSTLAAALARDGDLLTREPCSKTVPSYADYRTRQLATFQQEADAAHAQQLQMRPVADATAALISENEYAARHEDATVVCERLSYSSDGLRVTAYLWRPAATSLTRLPLIIFNRGGALEDSKLRPNTQFGFDRFVKAGYVVLGSQYRGNDGGEGREEMGGADVHDVTALLTLGRALPYVDSANIFALGYSRGAMMTLLTIRGGAKFNAAALVGAPSDLTKSLSTGDQRNLTTFRALIPNFDADPLAALRARSALYWAEELSVPLLLLQGGADPLVSVSTHTLPFAARLQQLHKTYELMIYDGDTHGVMINGHDRDTHILEWFARFHRLAAQP